mmetsp:Transcript_17526/g.42108  ORF Transcript_17526/g.42108 Transcript_17526/m.42108 type:complete len:87 (-) Transcript_17526:94-354(-)
MWTAAGRQRWIDRCMDRWTCGASRRHLSLSPRSHAPTTRGDALKHIHINALQCIHTSRPLGNTLMGGWREGWTMQAPKGPSALTSV